MLHLGTQAARQEKAWATPNAFCFQPPENTEQWTKRAEYQQTEKGVNLHKPIQTQVLHEVEKMWRTPSVAEEKNQNTSTQIYLQNQVGATPKAWATPRAGKTTDENPETWAARQAKGDVATMPLGTQVKLEDWPTVSSAGVTGGPTGLAGGSGNRAKMKRIMGSEMNAKLNPRWVETLMGLPVGWTMPSCKSPVTIEPTNCDSSETESFQQQQSERSESFGRNSND
jgi:hypothetical protein